MNIKLLAFLFIGTFVLMCNSASAEIPQDFYFAFDYTEGSGSTAYNQNTSNSDMTVYGTETWSVENAVYFNGSSGSYGEIPDGTDVDILDTITLSATINPSGNANSIFISKNYGYQLRLVSSKPRFVIWDSSVTQFTCESPDTISLTSDHTIQGVANGTHMWIVVDGVVKNTIEYTENDIRNSPNTVVFGAQETDSNNQKALLYDTYIYARALDEAELATLEGAGGGTPPIATGFTVNSALQSGRIQITAGSGNLTELSNTEYASNYFWKEGTIMYCNQSIWVDAGSELYINDSDITEFRIDGQNSIYAIYGEAGEGNIILNDGVDITEWNVTSDSVRSDTHLYLWLTHSNNSTITGFSNTKISYNDDDVTVSNVALTGSTDTLGSLDQIIGKDGFTLSNFDFFDRYTTGHQILNFRNSTISNILIDNVTLGTTAVNLDIANVSDTTIEYVTIRDCIDTSGGQRTFVGHSDSQNNIYRHWNLSAASLPLTDNGANGLQVGTQTNATYENLTIQNSAHNLIDFHYSHYITVDGFYLNGTLSNGIIISTNTSHVNILNGTIDYTPSGRGIHGHTNISDILIMNVYMPYRGIGLCAENLTIINVTIPNDVDSYSELTLYDYDQMPENDTIIDSSLQDLDVSLLTNNVDVINTHYETLTGTGITEYFYLNARALNTSGYPVADAEMTFDTTTLDGWGHVTTSIMSDENGYFHITGNRSTFAALEEDIQTLVTVTKSGEIDTETVTPDTGWYSTDISTGGLSGTLYTFTLDVQGEGDTIPLSILSFAPTDTTPESINGTSQTFTLTINQDANISWYVDSELQEWDNSTTSPSFAVSKDVGVYNITAIVDGELSQTWTWTVSEYVTPSEEEISWDDILSRAQTDTENAISLGAILPILIISIIIIGLLYGMATDVIEFETGITAILIMLVVSLILLVALPIFNSLYS